MTPPPHDDGREGAPQPGPWSPQGPLQPPQAPPDSPYGQTWPPPGQHPYGPPPGWGPAPHGGPSFGRGPYGQPPFGPPPGPSRRSRAGLVAALVGGALLLLVLGAILFSPGPLAFRPEVLDPHAVERDVAGQFEQREGVAIDIDCPERMKVQAGATYECTGVTADDEPVTLRITITDEDNAGYTWTEP